MAGDQNGKPAFDPNGPIAPVQAATPAKPAFDPNGEIAPVPVWGGRQADTAAKFPQDAAMSKDQFDSAQSQGESGLSGVLTGFEKGAGQTGRGAAHLLNHVLPDSMQIPDSANDTTPHGVAENVGNFGEGMTEYAGMEGLVKMATQAPKLLAMINAYPKAAKIILGAATQAGMGAAQGGVKGAANNEGGKGAAEGAALGAGGELVGEAGGTVLKKILRGTGVGGFTAAENLTKAAGGSVNVGTQNWQQSVQRVLPLIQGMKFNTIGEFADGVHDTANQLWSQYIQPQIDRHANEVIDTSGVQQQIRSTVTKTLTEHFPEEAAEIERFANTFNKPKTVAEANENIQSLNARLKSFYRQSAEGKAATVKSDEQAASLEAAVGGLRDSLYSRLQQLGEKEPANLRQNYGALKEVERVFDKRATVADRQAPMNLTQLGAVITGVGEAGVAIGSQHPMAAIPGVAMPIAAAALKHAQAPATLARRAVGPSTAVGKAAEEATHAAGQAVGAATKPAIVGGGNALANSGPPKPADGSIRVQLSDGSPVDVHQEDFGKFMEMHPDAKVIH